MLPFSVTLSFNFAKVGCFDCPFNTHLCASLKSIRKSSFLFKSRAEKGGKGLFSKIRKKTYSFYQLVGGTESRTEG